MIIHNFIRLTQDLKAALSTHSAINISDTSHYILRLHQL